MNGSPFWKVFMPMLESAAIAGVAVLASVLYAVVYLRWIKGQT